MDADRYSRENGAIGYPCPEDFGLNDNLKESVLVWEKAHFLLKKLPTLAKDEKKLIVQNMAAQCSHLADLRILVENA